VRGDAGQVRDRIVAGARSNPLALLELPRGLRPAERAGGFGLAAASPLENRIEDRFTCGSKCFRRDTQQLLLPRRPNRLWRELAAARGRAAADRSGRGGSSGSRRSRCGHTLPRLRRTS
jgi:hypothetical protein